MILCLTTELIETFEKNSFSLRAGAVCGDKTFARGDYKNDQPEGWSFILIGQTLAQFPPLEAAHNHIFTDGGDRLKDQLFHGE